MNALSGELHHVYCSAEHDNALSTSVTPHCSSQVNTQTKPERRDEKTHTHTNTHTCPYADKYIRLKPLEPWFRAGMQAFLGGGMGRSKHIREESLVFVVADPDLAWKVFWKAALRVRKGALPMRSLSSVLITSSICDLTPPSSPCRR